MKSNIKFNCQTYPVLLAAEYGHHEILKLFKFHNWPSNRETSDYMRASETSQNDGKLHLKKLFKPKTSVRFDVSSNNGNVLHLVLKQPALLERYRFEEQKSIVDSGSTSQCSQTVNIHILNKLGQL